MQRRLDPETGVNKPFENVSGKRRIFKIFFREVVPILVIFFNAAFFDRVNFKQRKYQNDSRGVWGMLPRKIFENLHTVMAILVLFKQFLGKARHIFGP